MRSSEPLSPGPLTALRGLHREVDRQAGVLAARHAGRLQCGRGCADCCVDGIAVFEVEAERIRRAHPQLLEQGRPRRPGACAFLDADGACRIYDDRPYVCRTQGLPLRWFVQTPEGETVEHRDICPLNEPGPAVESLSADDCWTIGPVEGQLAALARPAQGRTMRRVPLRDLFRCGPKRHDEQGRGGPHPEGS